MTEPDEMSPEQRAKAVKALLIISPFGAAFCYLLAAIQKAEPWARALIAGVMLVGCLGAALLIHLRGSKAGGDAAWIAMILRLLSRR